MEVQAAERFVQSNAFFFFPGRSRRKPRDAGGLREGVPAGRAERLRRGAPRGRLGVGRGRGRGFVGGDRRFCPGGAPRPFFAVHCE